MPTATQLAQRQNHLGASDLAALFGLDPRRNAYDLWLEKTGKLLPEDEPDNDPREAGILLEEGVLRYAEKRLGPLVRNQYRSAKDRGIPLGAHIDALLKETNDPVEAKTSGLYGFTGEEWGADYTDQVPDRVIIQAHGQMIAVERVICYVPAFIAFRGFAMFQIPYDAELAERISTEASRFWTQHVLADTPPTDLTPNLAVVKRVRREPQKVVEIETELVATWRTLNDSRKTVEKQEKDALAAVLAAMGDAEAADCEIGRVTHLEQTRGAYTVPESTFRVTRFKKA